MDDDQGKGTYNKISETQRLNVIYGIDILEMKTALIAKLNNINYNSVRKVISIYNRKKSHIDQNSTGKLYS